MHILGFRHEHQRPDRDNYVEFLTMNIVAAGSFTLDLEIWTITLKKVKLEINAFDCDFS